MADSGGATCLLAFQGLRRQCCQSILPESCHPNDCCASEPAGGRIHTTRPYAKLSIRPTSRHWVVGSYGCSTQWTAVQNRTTPFLPMTAPPAELKFSSTKSVATI